MTQKTKTRKKRLVRKINFKIKENQSLVILYCLLPDAGLERIVVENKDGITHVYADGRSQFEFSDISKTKDNPNLADFILSNRSDQFMIEDIIRSKFWSQFNWGEIFKYQKDKNFKRAVNRKIRKLVQEFEKKAAEELNQLRKNTKNKKA